MVLFIIVKRRVHYFRLLFICSRVEDNCPNMEEIKIQEVPCPQVKSLFGENLNIVFRCAWDFMVDLWFATLDLDTSRR